MRLEESCPKYAHVSAVLDRIRAIEADCRRQHEDGLADVPELRPPGTLDALADSVDGGRAKGTRSALVALEKAGDVEITRDGPIVRVDRPSMGPEVFERRERYERMKLDAMIGYVQRAPCRRRYLVDYFGDRRRPDQCGVCDRCKAPGARVLEGERLEHAQMALSCVARMKGRFGRVRVAEVLLGKETEGVRRGGLAHLSTFGLLSAWTKDEVTALLDGLVRAGYAQVTTDEYPKLALTEEGATALRDRQPLAIATRLGRWGDPVIASSKKKRPRAKKKLEEVRNNLEPPQRELLDRLREWRTQSAKEMGMPAYVVASDQLLTTIAVERPETLDALSRVSGIGDKKLEAYGADILGIVTAVE